MREWLLLGLDGDKIAYERFLEKAATMIRGYLFNSMSAATRSAEKAEDLVQDVLVTIHRKKHLYRADMPILPWLFAIARYRLIDHVRAEKRRPSLVAWEEDFDPADPAPLSLSVEQAFDLEQLLEGISARQREILLLAKVDRVPLAEIAERFDISLSAVKVTIHRALRKIRKSLARA